MSVLRKQRAEVQCIGVPFLLHSQAALHPSRLHMAGFFQGPDISKYHSPYFMLLWVEDM